MATPPTLVSNIETSPSFRINEAHELRIVKPNAQKLLAHPSESI